MTLEHKSQAEFDLDTFVDLFDTAMTSDNPAVQKAFRNLMMISTLVSAETKETTLRLGPLRKLVDDMQSLNRRVMDLEGSKSGYTYTTTTGPVLSGFNSNSATYTIDTTKLNWPGSNSITISNLTKDNEAK